MRIGVTTFGGDGGVSGISQYIVQMLRALARVDETHEYEVLVYEDEADVFVGGCPRMKAVPFSRSLRPPVVNLAWHQLALPGWVKRRGYDLLFLPAGNRRLPWRCPCPSVGTVHDMSSLHVDDKYDAARMIYIKKVLPWLIRKLTHVLTVSESSRRDIVEYVGIPPDRVTVTPLGVDHEQFVPGDPEAARARIGRKYGIDGPFVLYISRIEHPGKNHVGLIRAFGLLKSRQPLPHKLVLAGSDRERAEEVHREAERSPHARDIVFTGFTDGRDLPDLYRAAAVFAFPSLYEGFGLPVLEAMCAGTPVVCADVSSIPEVAGDAALLFPPRDESAMADALARALLDAGERRRMIEAGQARARTYSWDAAARSTLEVFSRARVG